MSTENEYTLSVSPTADLGSQPEQPARRTLFVSHRAGVLATETLDWHGPAKTHGRGPAVRPLNERPVSESGQRGDS
jgi:hypothetical protein